MRCCAGCLVSWLLAKELRDERPDLLGQELMSPIVQVLAIGTHEFWLADEPLLGNGIDEDGAGGLCLFLQGVAD